MFLNKIRAFLKRDFQQMRSYRLSFILQFFGYVFPLVGLFFMNRLFNSVEVSAIDRYGSSYVPFLLVGVVVTTYSGTALSAFSGSLRGAQARGTLELLLLTRTSLPTVICGWATMPFIRSTLFMIIYLVSGIFIVGLSFENANFLGASVILALMILVMGSLGLLASSFTLVFKQGDPFTGMIVLAAGFLSGTAYPVSILPKVLQWVAQGLPQTHAIESMRLAMLQGYSVSALTIPISVLALYSVILIPLGLLAFKYAMRRARAEGTLAHF